MAHFSSTFWLILIEFFSGCFLLCYGQLYGCSGGSKQGTTSHIKEIFLGRCYEYQSNSPLSSCKRVEKNCTRLLELFLKPFYGKDPCYFKKQDYDDFFKEVHVTTNKNEALFWSGTGDIAHTYSYSGRRFTTLEDTLSGYLMNNLTICGQKDFPYLNYENCPNNYICGSELHSSSFEYWSRASKQFAETARGIITVVLNGSRDDSFRNTSYFAQFELPNLRVENVQKVRVLLVYTLDQPKSEKCSTGSVKILKQKIEAIGFAYECVDDSAIIKFLLCAENPEARECLRIIRLMSSSSQNKVALPIMIAFLLIAFSSFVRQ